MAHRWKYSPLTAVAYVRFADLASHLGLVFSWFSSSLQKVFLRSSSFPLSTKNQLSKFQFDLETAGKKSHLVECPLLNFLYYFDSQIEVSFLICRDTCLFSLHSISDSLNIVLVVNHHVL